MYLCITKHKVIKKIVPGQQSNIRRERLSSVLPIFFLDQVACSQPLSATSVKSWILLLSFWQLCFPTTSGSAFVIVYEELNFNGRKYYLGMSVGLDYGNS